MRLFLHLCYQRTISNIEHMWPITKMKLNRSSKNSIGLVYDTMIEDYGWPRKKINRTQTKKKESRSESELLKNKYGEEEI